MSTNQTDRFTYHPDPLDMTRRRGGRGRAVENRRKAIESRVDLKGRTLVDFGCSGGYFGFAWADRLARYTGIDGDSELIARNRDAAQKRGLAHIDFRAGDITPAFIRSLEPADVGIFLSVFHHIQAVSTAYAWNRPREFDPVEILRAMREKLGVLVFETGYPNEGFEWCERLPPMLPDPRSWVLKTLADVGFNRVDIITSRDIHGPLAPLRSGAAHRLGVIDHPTALVSRVFQRIVRHDPRDDRDVFIAR